jgi:hypothetical protein
MNFNGTKETISIGKAYKDRVLKKFSLAICGYTKGNIYTRICTFDFKGCKTLLEFRKQTIEG